MRICILNSNLCRSSGGIMKHNIVLCQSFCSFCFIHNKIYYVYIIRIIHCMLCGFSLQTSKRKWHATASGRGVFNFLICLLYFISHFHRIFIFLLENQFHNVTNAKWCIMKVTRKIEIQIVMCCCSKKFLFMALMLRKANFENIKCETKFS